MTAERDRGSCARRAAREGRSGSRRDPLEDYGQKRDFSRTAEPKPKPKPKPQAEGGKDDGWQFVVQKHDARRVHYDLRLELGGTLKSWAVTRGPSLIAGEKRLAVRTEDHPMQYLDFEGNIPKGEYGGGAMIVWDRGRWSAAFDPDKGLQKGHLEFTLDGTRLKGRWHLVRMRPRRGREEGAMAADQGRGRVRTSGRRARHHRRGDHLVSQRPHDRGARGARRIAQGPRRPRRGDRRRARVAPPDPSKRARRAQGNPAGLPRAEPAANRPTSRRAARSGCTRSNTTATGRKPASMAASVRLLTRKGLDWTSRFPNIAAALKTLGLSSALIDGEIVVEDSAGIPSFALLQADLSTSRRDRFRYFLFDLLYCEGFDLTKATLLDRKALLQEIVGGLPPALAHPLQRAPGAGRADDVRARLPPWPGRNRVEARRSAISARARRRIGSSPKAFSGRSSSSWAMFPRPPPRARSARCWSATSMAGTLHYAGRVGTGYSSDQARSLRAQLDKIAAAKPKLGNALPAGAEKGVRWVEPQLVCEVEYRGWTADKLIRQSVVQGTAGRPRGGGDRSRGGAGKPEAGPRRASSAARRASRIRNESSGRSRASPRRAWRNSIPTSPIGSCRTSPDAC